MIAIVAVFRNVNDVRPKTWVDISVNGAVTVTAMRSPLTTGFELSWGLQFFESVCYV